MILQQLNKDAHEAITASSLVFRDPAVAPSCRWLLECCAH
jgi:hypothetical protein